jgi:chaperonin GroES
MKIRPLADKVLVERLEADTKTAGGIVLPDTAKEKPHRGKIVNVGEGKLLDDGTRRAMQVKKGDTVLFTSYAGSEVKIGGKEYMIMDESDILAVIES